MRALLVAAALTVAAHSSWAWTATCGSPRDIARSVVPWHPVLAWTGEVDLPEPLMGRTTLDAVGFWNPDSDAWVRVIIVEMDGLHCVYDGGSTMPPWGEDA